MAPGWFAGATDQMPDFNPNFGRARIAILASEIMSKLVVTLLLFLGLAMAQHQMAPPPEKPVALLPGLGTWRHPIATKDPEAQKYFDQGLALLYGFNRYEALRSFRKASELDPAAVMPYWGMAMAQGPYINMDGDAELDMKASCAAVEAGLKLTGGPPH